ncbi:bifunctional (p)ppGpp synthetase/guanosine-3',5'-bis(diphosphate) 3'-pyrophosphohydrolase [Candidatus Saccharibacteria bacterium]|nr:bifunctional (p)ppGpp synthetase/guanosine-3',5'-bis(diphosphate) 3'-pyrophosphohydrolase [Candidatus Saccharibacteria bacterium]
MGKLLDKAIVYATEKHSGDFRKGTSVPYIVHPLEAVAIVASITDDDDILAAAALHDVVEDTGTPLEEIRKEFNDHIADLVASESEDKREDQPAEDTWKIRKEETITFLKTASYESKLIAIGDKLSNIRAIAREYEVLGKKLWEKFRIKDKSEHGWYYSSLAEIFTADEKLKNTNACREYVEKVHQVFGE